MAVAAGRVVRKALTDQFEKSNSNCKTELGQFRSVGFQNCSPRARNDPVMTVAQLRISQGDAGPMQRAIIFCRTDEIKENVPQFGLILLGFCLCQRRRRELALPTYAIAYRT